ncbi:hypothetical protein F5Y18DRAFT_198848 [Xylariaceae sp. FL1019]|nr:hypothetical protein F5Y18DRAFT_198848 [Xylariaceae sp. FL1019]
MSKKALQGATEWVKANPRTTATVATGAVFAAAPMAVAAPVLGVLGFGAAGPVAGGIAAGVQAGVGNVVAPSVFATLQSAAMGGYGAAVVGGVVQAAGGVVAGAAGLKEVVKAKLREDSTAPKSRKGKEDDNNDDDDDDEEDENGRRDDDTLIETNGSERERRGGKGCERGKL